MIFSTPRGENFSVLTFSKINSIFAMSNADCVLNFLTFWRRSSLLGASFSDRFSEI